MNYFLFLFLIDHESVFFIVRESKSRVVFYFDFLLFMNLGF